MKKLNLSIMAMALSLFISCSDKEKVVPVNEEEVITTVTTTLTGGGQNITLKSKDADGDGPGQPVFTIIGTVKRGTVYTGSVKFENELVSPTKDITPEVVSEGTDHQLFFEAPTSLGTFAYNDTDADGKPIGVSFTLSTGANSVPSVKLIVTLKHLPNKNAVGVSSGIITNAGGKTDAEGIYTFPVSN